MHMFGNPIIRLKSSLFLRLHFRVAGLWFPSERPEGPRLHLTDGEMLFPKVTRVDGRVALRKCELFVQDLVGNLTQAYHKIRLKLCLKT